jgi:hypothetical protein
VVKEPEWGATRLRNQLAQPEHGELDLDARTIYEELVRLRLNTKERRIAYALRHGHEHPAELQARLEELKSSAVEEESLAAQAEEMEAEYTAGARQRVQVVLDRMDTAAENSGLPEADRELLQEVVDELAPVADGQILADFITRMVAKLATAKSVRRADPGPRVLNWEKWAEQDRAGFESLAEKGIDLPEDPVEESDASPPSLDDIVGRKGGDG